MAERSFRGEGLNAGDVRRCLTDHGQIIAGLHVHPELRRGVERPAKAQSGIGGNRNLFPHQALNAGARHPAALGHRSLALSASAPSWLSFDRTTGVLSGMPTDRMTGLETVTVTATDLGGKTASATLALSRVGDGVGAGKTGPADGPGHILHTPGGRVAGQRVGAGGAAVDHSGGGPWVGGSAVNFAKI